MKHVIVMGVAGCGKSTVGRQLADRLGADYFDGDDYHPESNRKKMTAGIALDDEDRRPWLFKLNQLMLSSDRPVVVACSALKADYRKQLMRDVKAVFVFLDVHEEVIVERLKSRDHFFPVSLVSDQFETLELPTGDNVITVNAAGDPDMVVEEALSQIRRAGIE